jgi:MFS family permease
MFSVMPENISSYRTTRGTGERMKPSHTAERSDYISLLACLSLLLVAPLGGLALSGLTPVLPRISDHFAGDPQAPTLVRLMVSGFSFAMVGGSLAAGFMTEKIGQCRLLIWCMGLYAIAGTMGAFLDNLYLIVASRLLLGVLNAIAAVVAMTLITTRIAPQVRDRWLGFYIVVGTFGSIILLGLSGKVGDADWRNVFLLHLLAVPVVLLLIATLPRAPSEADRAKLSASGSNSPQGGVPWALVVLGAICGAVLSTSLIFLPFYLVTVGAGTPGQIAGAMVGASVTAGVVSFGYGWLRKWLSVVQVFVVGFSVAFAGMALVATMTDFTLIVAAMVLFGVGVGVLSPNLFSAVAAATRPERRARTIGIVRAGSCAGPLIAQILLEPFAHWQGSWAPMMGIALIAAAGLVHVLLFRRTFAPAPE